MEIEKSIIINIPYYKSYATDLVTYQLRLTPDKMIKAQTAIAEICLYGETNYNPENSIEKMYFDKMHTDLKASIKTYRASVENGKLGGRPKTQKKPIGSSRVNPIDNPEHNPQANHNRTRTITKDKPINNIKYKEFVADELKFIKITEEEYKKLSSKYSISDITNYLKQISLYVGTSGKKYKSHYMACLSWFNRDGIKTTEEKEQIKKDGW